MTDILFEHIRQGSIDPISSISPAFSSYLCHQCPKSESRLNGGFTPIAYDNKPNCSQPYTRLEMGSKNSWDSSLNVKNFKLSSNSIPNVLRHFSFPSSVSLH